MKNKINYLIILIPSIIMSTITFPNEKHFLTPHLVTSLSINNYDITVEVADNVKQRELGLMFRKSIKPNHGMLFVYKSSKLHCMWMKNTQIPLSVAFIDKSHKIINIKPMEPFNKTPQCSDKPAKFALEMNSGWFKKNGVLPGQKVYGLNN